MYSCTCHVHVYVLYIVKQCYSLCYKFNNSSVILSHQHKLATEGGAGYSMRCYMPHFC